MSQSSIVPLSKSQHAALTFSPLEDYSFCAAMTAMPLLPFEVAQAAHYYAIAFPAAGSAIPYALLGLGDTNIFVNAEGRWTAPYVPIYAANYPFSMISTQSANQPESPQGADPQSPQSPEAPEGQAEIPEVVLAFEQDAPHFSQPDGQPLYEKNGEASPLLKRITRTLGNQYQAHKNMEKALAQLNLAHVLHERSVTLNYKGTTRTVGGLRIANREMVMALPEPTLGGWAKNGLLEMLFAHWGSMRHLQELLEHSSCPAQPLLQ